jgi:hypothetical protein
MANTKQHNKSGLGLNMLIARSHQIATQIVSVQLAIANLLAIAVSAVSIVAGTVTITLQRYPASWPLWVIAGIIGAGLAILIEGMTLGALIRIRLATQKIRVIDERIEAERNETIPSTLDKGIRKAKERELRHRRARATKRLRRMRLWSGPIVLVGGITSAVAGGLFYHTTLAGLGQWESIAVAALFPFVVTCTFISSELFKDIQEEAIREGYTGGGLADAALREETRRLSFQAVHDGMLHHFHDSEIQEELKLGTRDMLKDIIIDLRRTVSGTITAPKEGMLPTVSALLSAPKNEEETTVSSTETPQQNESTTDGLTTIPDPNECSVEQEDIKPHDPIFEEQKTEQQSTPAADGDTGIIPLNKDLLEVVLRYPKVESSWLAKNKKSATMEEIRQVTGHSKRRLNRAPFQRSSRNKELIRISSVIDWLKTAPDPRQKTQDTQAFQTVLNGQEETTTPRREESTTLERQVPVPGAIPETPRPTREADTLELACQFLREHPEYLTDASPEAEQALAAHLGLARPASARECLLKAREILQQEGAAQDHQDSDPVANGHSQEGLETLQDWVPSHHERYT